MYFFCLQVDGLTTGAWGEGGLKLGVEGRIISERLLYGLCELQCPNYFSGLKPREVGRNINKELQRHYLE